MKISLSITASLPGEAFRFPVSPVCFFPERYPYSYLLIYYVIYLLFVGDSVEQLSMNIIGFMSYKSCFYNHTKSRFGRNTT